MSLLVQLVAGVALNMAQACGHLGAYALHAPAAGAAATPDEAAGAPGMPRRLADELKLLAGARLAASGPGLHGAPMDLDAAITCLPGDVTAWLLLVLAANLPPEQLMQPPLRQRGRWGIADSSDDDDGDDSGALPLSALPAPQGQGQGRGDSGSRSQPTGPMTAACGLPAPAGPLVGALLRRYLALPASETSPIDTVRVLWAALRLRLPGAAHAACVPPDVLPSMAALLSKQVRS